MLVISVSQYCSLDIPRKFSSLSTFLSGNQFFWREDSQNSVIKISLKGCMYQTGSLDRKPQVGMLTVKLTVDM